jgi:four helix bundle protein
MDIRKGGGKAANSFEDLHIYQEARQLANGVYAVTRNVSFARDLGLVDQVRRAAVSVMSNIAEGFERGAKAEFVQFLYIAKGSCGEVRAQLQVAMDQQYLEAGEFTRLYALARKISSMTSNFIAYLQGSRYRGDKVERPRRQSQEAYQRRIQDLRAAQLRNIEYRDEGEGREGHNPAKEQGE